MKKGITALVIVIVLSVSAFASNSDLLEKWMYSNYYAKRIMIETGPKTRIRREEVYKWGPDKFVKVYEPVKVNWVRVGQLCYMGEDVLRRSPMLILDLEDLAFKEILQKSPYSVKKTEEGTLVEIRGSGVYRVLLDQNGFPKEIERYYMDTKSRMIYEEVRPLTLSKEEVLKGYTLEESEIKIPPELLTLLSNFRFIIVREGVSGLEIEGVFKNGQRVEIFVGTNLSKEGFKITVNGIDIVVVSDRDTLNEIKLILQK